MWNEKRPNRKLTAARTAPDFWREHRLGEVKGNLAAGDGLNLVTAPRKQAPVRRPTGATVFSQFLAGGQPLTNCQRKLVQSASTPLRGLRIQ
jgi:hypothetical protein